MKKPAGTIDLKQNPRILFQYSIESGRQIKRVVLDFRSAIPGSLDELPLLFVTDIEVDGGGGNVGVPHPVAEDVDGDFLQGSTDAKSMPQPFRSSLETGDISLFHHALDDSPACRSRESPESALEFALV